MDGLFATLIFERKNRCHLLSAGSDKWFLSGRHFHYFTDTSYIKPLIDKEEIEKLYAIGGYFDASFRNKDGLVLLIKVLNKNFISVKNTFHLNFLSKDCLYA